MALALCWTSDVELDCCSRLTVVASEALAFTVRNQRGRVACFGVQQIGYDNDEYDVNV